MTEKPLYINLVLKGELLEKFVKIKNNLGVTDPNTKTLEKCIETQFNIL